MLFDKLEPIGAHRSDVMMARICSTLVNIYNAYGAKKGTKPETVEPIDFIDWLLKDKEFFEGEKTMTPEEVVEMVKSQFGL